MSAADSADLVVVGGGIAGTMAVLTAAARGLDVAWIADAVTAADQSAHWHGHLHRGRLYDPVRESELIEELGQNVAFWWSNEVVRFHTELETVALGWDERWADGFRRRMRLLGSAASRPSYLTPSVAFVRTDEAVLDGPAFLAAAGTVARSVATAVDGRCTAIRPASRGRWTAEARGRDGSTVETTAGAVVLATGTAMPQLLPRDAPLSASPDVRLSRMLVLRGALPPAAAIIPSRAAGGLFFASREVPGPSGERVWLVSDGYSSPGSTSPGALTDGWWVCSVLERLAEFIDPGLLTGLEVGGYLAPKSRLLSSPTQVPAHGYAVDGDRSLVALLPAKWSTAPTTAAHALAALIPDPVPAAARAAEVAELLSAAPLLPAPAFAETWQSVTRFEPAAALREPGLPALRRASALLADPSAPPAALPVRAVA